MIEAYALTVNLYKEPARMVSLHEAVEQALRSPKAVLVGEPAQPHPNPLERIVAQASEGKNYTLEQVRRELEKPYLDPTKDGIFSAYSDMLSRGKIVKVALSIFSADELKQLYSRTILIEQ